MISSKRELFDLSADPREEHDLHSSGHSAIRELDRRLEEWMRVTPLATSGGESRRDKATMEGLRSLGYVQ